MVNEYVVNTHKIENGKLKPLVKEFSNIYVQCREKSTIKSISLIPILGKSGR